MWNAEEADKHFFIYHEYTDSLDLLHSLRSLDVASSELKDLTIALRTNLRSTALATSIPWHTALLGAFNGRASVIESSLHHLKQEYNRSSFSHVIEQLKDVGAPIAQAFGVLQTIHERGMAGEAFAALLQQASAMMWAALEAFASDVLCHLFCTDLGILRDVVRVQKDNDPWGNRPKKLMRWMESEHARDPTIKPHVAIASFPLSLALNLNAMLHFSGILFPDRTLLLSTLQSQQLKILSARRHLLMHSAGIVDVEYTEDSGEPLTVGSALIVTPDDVRRGFRSVAETGVLLAQAADALLLRRSGS